MAELLVYGKKHWHEDLVTTGMDEFTLNKVNSSYRKGDVIRIVPDGHYSSRHPWNKDKFFLIKIPSATINEYKYLENESITMINGKEVVYKKRRYGLNTGSITIPQDRVVTLNKSQLNVIILEKS